MSLKQLNVRNFALIKNLEIELENGLTVVTGETGAGKSIIIDALNLLLGSRAEVNMIRHGEDQCDISADFDISNLADVSLWLAEKDFTVKPDAEQGCLIRRIIKRDKPTKCYINDQPTTLASLRELGLLLVDLHGQHEHQSLLRSATQRQIIDQFADHLDTLKEMAKLAAQIQRISKQLTVISEGNIDNANHMELLSFQLNEFSEAGLVDDEYEELLQTQSRLGNAQLLSDGLELVIDKLYHNEDTNIVTELGKQINILNELSNFDSSIKPSCELLNSALSEITEAQSILDSNLAQIEQNPERLHEIEQRLDTYINLARKHRCTESHLSERYQELQTEFDRLATMHAKPEILQQELDQLNAQYLDIATIVSVKRQKVAKQLSKQITEQMQELGMQGGYLEIRVEVVGDPQVKARVSENGFDSINYMVSTNQGMPPKLIQKTASGGELSRISLAIQVIASARANTPCLVFDEVDVGVGGSIAATIGSRMRGLGSQTQVICITHLAQVASQGHHHLAVRKNTVDSETQTTLMTLSNNQRTEEIARMLGGAEITERTLAHAQEMLENSNIPPKSASAS